MPRLPRVSGRECIRALQKLGFQQVRQRGSHVTMKKRTGGGEVGCTVPLADIVPLGTLSQMLRTARVTAEEFIEALG